MLGWRLASPSRRLVAIVVDLVVVGILTLLGWRVLGVLAATGFVWMAVRNTPTSAKGKAFRWTGGCLGAFILFVVIVTTGEVAQRLISSLSESERLVITGDSVVIPDVPGVPGVRNVLSGLGGLTEFRSAASAEQAEAVAIRMFNEGAELGMPPHEVEELLLSAADAGAEWDASDVIERARDTAAGRAADAESASDDDVVPLTPALLEYADLLEQGDASTAERRAELEAAILGAVGADSLAALQDRVGDLESEVRSAERRNDQLREDLREAREGGLFGWLYNIVDQLGLTFGWGALYFAFLLYWFDGLTPGKRLMGIRVKRLDGEPMTWFLAFERSGGYAAGFATGLLGFAQLLWDANRQAIHDRIAGTVVVVDGAERARSLARRPY